MTKAVVVMKRKMNQCVFLASLLLQLSRFHWGIFFFFFLPSSHNSQVHKTMSSFSFRAVQDTSRAHSTISWDFPARRRKQPITFRKLKYLIKAVVMKSRVFFLQIWGFNNPASKGGKYCFYPKGPIPRFTKSCFLVASELCKDIPSTHCTSLYEKKGQGRVFCACWLTYLQLTWLGETVVSDDFPAWSGKQPVFSRKLKKLTKDVVVMQRKMNQCVFFWQFWSCNYPASTGGKYCFYRKGPFPRFTKSCFLAALDLHKDTPRTHCTISWEKKSGESVLRVLTTVPLD